MNLKSAALPAAEPARSRARSLGSRPRYCVPAGSDDATKS